MFQIEAYTAKLLERLKQNFGDRLVYLGLQGSYLRGEQHEGSDIDIMAVLDYLTAADLDVYRNVLIEVGEYEKSCGFFCGTQELAGWNALELCHLLHTTKDLYGNLADFLPAYTLEDEKNFIRLSVGNLYHELCHRFVHADQEQNRAQLPATCKAIFFIMQNLHFIKQCMNEPDATNDYKAQKIRANLHTNLAEEGVFLNSKAELLSHLEGQDREVLALSIKLEQGNTFNFDQAFQLLFSWCQNTLQWLKNK